MSPELRRKLMYLYGTDMQYKTLDTGVYAVGMNEKTLHGILENSNETLFVLTDLERSAGKRPQGRSVQHVQLYGKHTMEIEVSPKYWRNYGFYTKDIVGVRLGPFEDVVKPYHKDLSPGTICIVNDFDNNSRNAFVCYLGFINGGYIFISNNSIMTLGNTGLAVGSTVRVQEAEKQWNVKLNGSIRVASSFPAFEGVLYYNPSKPIGSEAASSTERIAHQRKVGIGLMEALKNKDFPESLVSRHDGRIPPPTFLDDAGLGSIQGETRLKLIDWEKLNEAQKSFNENLAHKLALEGILHKSRMKVFKPPYPFRPEEAFSDDKSKTSEESEDIILYPVQTTSTKDYKPLDLDF